MLKVGSFSFGSPVSASAVGKPIFEIKATEKNNKISTPMLSGSVKNVVYFCSVDESSSPKSSGGGFSEGMVIFPHNIREIHAKIL